MFEKVWESRPLHIRLFMDFDNVRRSQDGHDLLSYRLKHHREIIFEGDDFGVSPMHAWDSKQSIGALLNFLSLRPGDIEEDWFASYTPRQLEFAEQFGDELQMYATKLEESEDD